MNCGKCPEGRRFNQTGIYCVYYGIIMNEKHECTLERGLRHERDADNSEEQRTGAEIRQGCIGIA